MNELQKFEYLKFQYGKEDLNQVFATVLDTFPHITGATVSGHIYLWDALQRIKYNFVYDIDVQTFLLPKYLDGWRNSVYDKIKEQLPAICYNASFNGYKDKKHLKAINHLMFLDIDDFPTRQDALEYKKQIIGKYPWIVACNLSLSRLGLHVIAMVDRIYDSRDYTDKYKYISSTYFENRLDKDSNKLTQYTVLPFDYDIYINEYPDILPIDIIYSEHKKSIRSAYIVNPDYSGFKEKSMFSAYNTNSDDLKSIEKSISSAYISNSLIGSSIDEKSIRSVHMGEEIICTAHTFFGDSSLNNIMNDTARKYKLRFRLEADESLFTDRNVPLYVREGIDVMEVNLFNLRGSKIHDGNRHDFIGAMTVKMIYLNVDLQNSDYKEVRKAILKFLFHVNNLVCKPPMSKNEVLKSYNANWKRFLSGEMNFSKYFIKKRAFWSKQTTLRGNEKRKVTCRIKNVPIVEESKKRIYEAIETLMVGSDKITQVSVEHQSGLSISTVKKHWHEFKEMVKDHNIEFIGKQKPDTKSFPQKQEREDLLPVVSQITMQESKEIIVPIKNNVFMEIENIEKIDCDEDVYILGEEFRTVPNYISPLRIFEKIFAITLQSFDDNQRNKLMDVFTKHMNSLPESDAKVLSIDIVDILDSSTNFRQYTLEDQLRNSVWKEYQENN